MADDGRPRSRSGLSGPAEIEEPPRDRKPRTWRGRWNSAREATSGTLAALPRVFRLVWEASRPLTLVLAAATVVAGLMPAVSAYAAKLLINSVVQAIIIHQRHLPDQASLSVPFLFTTLRSPVLTATGVIVLLAAIQFVIYATNSLLSTARNIAQQLLQERVSMRIQLMVMTHAAALDLPFFEDPASYDLLRRAQTDSANRPVAMISGAFGLVQTALTFVSMVALLIGVSPWLAVIALVSPVPAFISDTRYGWRGYNMARWSSRLLRRMFYLTTLVTTDTFAKEVKLFNLGGFFIDRYRIHRRISLGCDNDVGRLPNLLICCAPGRGRPPYPGGPDPLHGRRELGPGIDPGFAWRLRLDVRTQPIPEQPVPAARYAKSSLAPRAPAVAASAGQR